MKYSETFYAGRRLANVPLLRHALESELCDVYFRGIDANWEYQDIIPMRMSGFNPLHRSLYLQSESVMHTWLTADSLDERLLNAKDQLVFEALFFAHDYLHIWSTAFIQAQFPQLGLGTVTITEENAEDLAFCLLMTEAVGTVGLDYWYLSTVVLDDVVELGTEYTFLAVEYHERDAAEYRRFRPALNVQSPAFLCELADVYAKGEISGFSLADIKRSPKLKKWLEHELGYGKQQRQYLREWVRHLGGLAPITSIAQLQRPMAIDCGWKRELIEALSHELWAKMKSDDMREPNTSTLPPLQDVWARPVSEERHFCYSSITGLNKGQLDLAVERARGKSDDNAHYLAMQLISMYKLDPGLRREFFPLAKSMIEKRDVRSLRYLLETSGLELVSPSLGSERIELFFRN